MKQYYGRIKQLPLFDHISEDKDLDWMFRCIDGNVKTYRAGDVIFSQGEEMYFAAVVVEGMVQGLTKEGDSALFDPGDMLFTDYSEGKSVPAPMEFVAKTDCSLLLMRWIRMTKVCNFECAFHKQLLENFNRIKK